MTTVQAPPSSDSESAPPSHPIPKPPWRQRIFGAGGLTFPAWAYLTFFFVIPLSLVVWYSFGYKPDLFTTYATDQLGLGRYREALGPEYRSTFLNTLQIASTGTILALAVGLPFAYWLAVKSNPRWRPLLIVLLMIPFWTNLLVRTIGWQITLAPSGWLSSLFQSLGGDPLEILYTRAAVQIGVVYNYLPLMILPLFVAMDRAGPSLREASRDLGANRLTTFMRVTLPLASPGIASGCLLVFIPLMGDYVTPQVLGGARGAMMGQTIASQFQTAQNWALGSAMTVTLMLLVLIIVALVAAVILGGSRLVNNRVLNVPETTTASGKLPELERPTLRPRRIRRDLVNDTFSLWAAVIYIFLFMPLLVIVVYSFNTGRVLASFDSFGFDSYSRALNNDTIVSSVQTSLQVAFLSAALATVLGSLAGIALAVTRASRWWGIGLVAILLVTLVAPDIANAVAYLPWFVTLGVDAGITPLNNGLIRLVIAHAAVSMVAVTFIVRARVAGLDGSLMEAAADLYGKPWARFRHVILPAAAPGIFAGFLLAFTFSLDDVVIASFVQQPGYTPWPVYIFSSVRVALRPEVAAMSTLMLLLTLIMLLAAIMVLRRGGQDSKSMVKMIGS